MSLAPAPNPSSANPSASASGNASASVLEQFKWETQPAAEKFVTEATNDMLHKNAFARELAGRMSEKAGTRFHDWIGHITIRPNDPRVANLHAAGWRRRDGEKAEVYDNPLGMFPAVVVADWGVDLEIGIKVDSVVDFLATNNISAKIVGEPLNTLRYATVASENGAALAVVERHGNRSFNPPAALDVDPVARLKHAEAFRTRKRDFDDAKDGFAEVNRLIDASIKDLGRDLTCDLFFAAEREYWMRKNRAAQVQYERQCKVGLGWANHDHHTYRSSRESFKDLVATWEKLGLVCRERFYAGKDAGWGAQVMEQPVTGIITFNDVDLSPEELMGDFSHDGLAGRDKLGTIGLWCGLHGEAALQAGMHHLECMFDFDALKVQLEAEGVRTMKPFTDFGFLRQAFTEGERWKVAEKRIQRLLDRKLITEEQAAKFRVDGAIGSHLENLERNEGFKGFNQTGVSEIIAATDPRRQAEKNAFETVEYKTAK